MGGFPISGPDFGCPGQSRVGNVPDTVVTRGGQELEGRGDAKDV